MKKSPARSKLPVTAETVRKLETVELVVVIGALNGTVAAGGKGNSCTSCGCDHW